MHTILGKTIKYILWIVFIFIVGMLLIGVVKFRGNVSGYISYLNARDRNEARGKTSGNPSSRGYIFRGSGMQSLSGEIDILSGDILSGDMLTGEDFTGLNAYDPSLETDLTTLSGDLATDDTSFGFTGTTEETPTSAAGNTGTSKEQLLNLIKQHELNK